MQYNRKLREGPGDEARNFCARKCLQIFVVALLPVEFWVGLSYTAVRSDNTASLRDCSLVKSCNCECFLESLLLYCVQCT